MLKGMGFFFVRNQAGRAARAAFREVSRRLPPGETVFTGGLRRSGKAVISCRPA